MKNVIIITALFLSCFISKAQYNPYTYAVAAAEVDEEYKLSNIRFDVEALKANPKAWSAYQDYLSVNSNYQKKANVYGKVTLAGLGVTCASFIPMLLASGYDYDDSRGDVMMGCGLGLLCAGGITSLIGCYGWVIQADRMNSNKKDFIFYLKTTNNGVGIVSLF